MGRFTRHGMDDQPLEGGGRGGGGGSGVGAKIAGAGITGAVLGTAYKGLEKAQNRADTAQAEKNQKEKQMVQEADDAKMQTKKDKAYNAAKTYPENFAKGGTASSRGDGIAKRGKTRGKMC